VLPNKTVRFDSDGLVIIGSRHPVTTRYSWCAPGDSEQTFLPSGEVRTRDLGYFDEDGFLYIRGRVDEIIVLGNGRNVLVPPLEQRIKTHPAVRECILVGMGEPFLTALVSPVNSAADAPSIQAFLDELNATLPADQRIHGLVVSEEPFTIENGMLSAQFKPLRKEIARRLGPQIAAVYAEELHSRRNFAVDA